MWLALDITCDVAEQGRKLQKACFCQDMSYLDDRFRVQQLVCLPISPTSCQLYILMALVGLLYIEIMKLDLPPGKLTPASGP